MILTEIRETLPRHSRKNLPKECSLYLYLSKGEIASLSCEPCESEELVISLFEVEHTPDSVNAFIAREHEFKFCIVEPLTLDGLPTGLKAVSIVFWRIAFYPDNVNACIVSTG
jgi:hypothetical protein